MAGSGRERSRAGAGETSSNAARCTGLPATVLELRVEYAAAEPGQAAGCGDFEACVLVSLTPG